MICPKCKKEDLEESEFDKRIGICSACGSEFTDKEYNQILKSVHDLDGGR